MKKFLVLLLSLVFAFSAILMVGCKQDPETETPGPGPSPGPGPGEATTVVGTLESVIYTFKGVGISLETSEKGVIQTYAEENAPVQAQTMSLAKTYADKEDTGSGIPESVSAVDDLEGVSMVHTIKSHLDMYFAERKLLDEGTEFERLSPPGMIVGWYESFNELDEALKDAEENFRIEIEGILGENEVVTGYYRKEGDKYIVGHARNTAGSEFEETLGKDHVYGYGETEYYIDETGALIVKDNAKFIVAEEYKDVIPEDYYLPSNQYYRILSTETSATIEQYVLWDGIDYKLMNMLTAVEGEDFYYIQAYNIDMTEMISAPGYLFNELVMSNPGLGETFTIEQRELIENEWFENCQNNGWHAGYPSIYLHAELAKDGDDGTFLFYRNFDHDEINLEVPENWLDLESFDVTTVLSSLEEINQPYMKHGELVAFNYENFITNDKK